MKRRRIAPLALVAAALLLGCVGPRQGVAGPEPAPEVAPVPEPAGLTVDGLLDRMESVRKSIQTFQADAEKIRTVELLDENERSKGRIQFKAPRLLRLDLTNVANDQQTIIIVGPEFGWIYRPYKKQAERGRLAEGATEAEKGNPLQYGLAKDMHGLREGYDLSLLPEEEVNGRRAVPLQLMPEGGTTYTRGRIIFWIDLESWLPVKIREYKSNDEIVETYTFSNIELNKRISDSTFEFKPPRDVDVILLDAQ